MKNLLTILLIFLTTFLYSQNYKKIFKNIQNENIEEAVKELKEIDSKNQYKKKDLILFQMATCLILVNEKSRNYLPFNALSVYKNIIIPQEEILEIDKFLEKFSYNVNSILDIIYSSVFAETKKIDTEFAYQNALDVCTGSKYSPCKYLVEINALKEKAAYRECKAIGTVEGFKYFLEKYKWSTNKNEILELLQDKEFEHAMKSTTVKSMTNFIVIYPDSKLKERATEIRDSLALPKEPRTFLKLSSYISTYPNSKYSSAIKKELPDVLYEEAITNNSIELQKNFIHAYPNDLRVDYVKKALEVYVDSINTTHLKKIANSDLAKEGLKGNIESIETKVNGGKDGYVIRSFNEFGKTKKFILVKNYYDKIERFEAINYPREFNEELLYITPIGFFKSTIYCGNKYDGASGNFNREEYDFEYDSTGNLLDISNGGSSFTYNENLDLTTKNQNHIKYKWKDGKLTSKNVYQSNGDIRVCYSVEYKNNQQIIKEYTSKKEEPDKIFTLVINNEGNVIIKKEVRYGNYYKASGVDIWPIYTNSYTYSNGFLTKIISQVHGKYVHQSLEPLIIEKKINRDTNGNILHIDEDNYGRKKFSHETEWTYKYDEHGNWIERTEYDVKMGDIKITKKKYEITRKITYYK